MKRIVLTFALLIAATNAFAWGEAGHLMSNEAATLSLPTDMPSFFYRAFPQLIWLGYQPDRLRGAGPSIDATNLPDHFLNYEMVEGLNLPPDRYKYLALLESSGRRAHLGVANTEPGFSPWRIAEMTEELTAEFRQWRLNQGSAERRAIEGEIISTAGVLGHFVADGANPLHDTENYNGWVMPNPNGYVNDCQIHARFETDFVSHSIVVSDVTPKVASPILRTDYFTTALDFIKSSNALVERVYQLDKQNAFSEYGPISPDGKAFVTDRLAAGSSLLRDLWWSAWKNSEKPPKRRTVADG
ncbi:MAG TPA: nuclease [Thermoanaerobaculia bacterium]|jgi:hypothetical protein